MVVKDLLEILTGFGFLTGSRAFGTFSEKSDYDIVFSVLDRADVMLKCENHRFIQSDYFQGGKIKLDDGEINLIFVHPHDFAVWFYATEAVKAILLKSGIKDRISKLALFESFRGSLKGLLPRLKNIKAYEELKLSLLGREIVKSEKPEDLPF